MRLLRTKTSEKLVDQRREILSTHEVFTIMYSGGLIDPTDAQVVERSVSRWISALSGSSIPTVEVVEMPWSRMKDHCVWMGCVGGVFIHPRLRTLDSLMATVEKRGGRVRRTSRQGNTAFDAEWRAVYRGWPLYYV